MSRKPRPKPAPPAKAKGKRGSTRSKAKPVPRERAPKETGRPPVEVDERLLRFLASINCTMEEIAAGVEVSVDTLERRFAEIIKEERARGRSSLRRWQWENAKKGNPTMLIWLGKMELGQKDVSRRELTGPDGLAIPLSIPIEFVDAADDDEDE